MMRFLVLSLIVALSGGFLSGALAAEPGEAQVEVLGKIQTSFSRSRVMLEIANARCAGSAEGLPAAGEIWRPMVTTGCHGDSITLVSFRDGVLFMGDGDVQIAPMPMPQVHGCWTGPRGTVHRTYMIGVCMESQIKDSGSSNMEMVTRNGGELKHYIASYGATELPITRGHPLAAVRISEALPAAPIWEYLVEPRLLRLKGTDLCLTPPIGDVTEGAPLHLDLCGAPESRESERRADTPRRQTVRPISPIFTLR